MRNFLLLLLLLVACTAPEATDPATATAQSVSETTSDTLTLETLRIYPSFDDLEPLFNQRNDTTYVINFWATWCKPCVEEMPYFEEYHEATKGEKTRLILVSLDFPKQYEKSLIPFINRRDLQPEVVALADGDYDSWIDRVSPDWEGEIPATYVYRGSESRFAAQQFHSLEEVREFATFR